MKKTSFILSAEKIANFFEVAGVMLVLLLAFLMQFVFNEPPCPLCLLQRYGFMAIAFGFLLNFRFGFRPSHYSIVLISSLFTAFVALRQISLHVLPNTGAYGSPIFGLHLYTWSFVVAVLVLVSTSLLLGVDTQYLQKSRKSVAWRYISYGIFTVLLFLTLANIISAIFECGFLPCPDNPITYLLIKR